MRKSLLKQELQTLDFFHCEKTNQKKEADKFQPLLSFNRTVIQLNLSFSERSTREPQSRLIVPTGIAAAHRRSNV